MSFGDLLNGIFEDNVLYFGAFLKLCLTPSAERRRPSQTDTSLCVCVCVHVPHGYAVCRVVACLLSVCVDARQGAVEKMLLGIHLICKWKKTHPHICEDTHTDTYTQTQVCLFPAGMICNWIGVLHWLTSKFWQNASRGKTSLYAPRTCHLPMLYLLSIEACENTFSYS